MILTINKPRLPYVAWRDIIIGDVFSWGVQENWYVKVSSESYIRLGSPGGLITAVNTKDCGTLVVAARVEITP